MNGNVLEHKLAELLGQFQSGVSQAGASAAKLLPQVTDLAIRMKFWDGVAHLACAALALLPAFALFKGVLFFHNLAEEKRAEKDFTTDDIPYQVGAITLGFALLVVSVAICCQLFDPWNWVAVFDPKIALAHDIYLGVMEKLR